MGKFLTGRLIGTAGSSLIAMVVSGCAVRMITPSEGGPTTISPATLVQARHDDRNYRAGSFRVYAEGPQGQQDLTGLLTVTQGSGGQDAAGTVTLDPSTTSIRATACFSGLSGGCPISVANVTLNLPRLVLAGTVADLIAGDTTNALSVALPAAATVPVTVTLNSPLTQSATVTIAAGSTTSVPVAITAQFAGSDTLTVAAPGYPTTTLPVAVRPKLVGMTPISGAGQTSVTLSGAGFNPTVVATVLFGTTSAAATVVSPSQISTTVPTFTAAQTVQVRVVSAGQQSPMSLPFAVTVAPGGGGTGITLFRSGQSDVQIIRFMTSATGGAFQIGASTPSNVSPGMEAVGLAIEGSTLLRASASALEAFTVGGTAAAPTLMLSGQTPATGPTSPGLTGAGAGAAILPNALVRGGPSGIETWQPATNPLARLQSVITAGAATGGQSLLADASRARVLRSVGSNLELWDVSNPAAPMRVANPFLFGSVKSPAIAWIDPGTKLVRSYANGIEIVAIGTDAQGLPTATRIGNNGTGGGTNSALGVSSQAGVIARATGEGLEFYSLSDSPKRCGISREGDLGPAISLALAVKGTIAFRTTPSSVEAYDLTRVVCTGVDVTASVMVNPVIQHAGLSPAGTGLGLVVAP